MNGLLQFLQAASNTAADTVAAPVDLLSMVLRKAGVPIPQAPVGGSDWMKNRGLIADVPQSGASLAGETMGLLAPVVAAAKAPQIAAGLLKMGENAAAPRALNPQTGAIVWHGSPHKFDKFDSSKIGTGEGAQAYGHGLYLAEDAKVAGSYQDKLSGALPTEIAAGGQALDFRAAAAQAFGDESADALVKSGAHMKPEAWAAVADVLRSKGLKDARPMAGSLYKVDLPDEAIARMLDWDKPLSQQAPGVQKAAAMRLEEIRALGGRPSADPSGEWLHRAFQPQAGEKGFGQSMAADRLRAAGIPGIRYLDGGSRGAGAGTSNFVVFPGEESLLRILERNGVPIR